MITLGKVSQLLNKDQYVVITKAKETCEYYTKRSVRIYLIHWDVVVDILHCC